MIDRHVMKRIMTRKNLQKCFTMGGILLELISKQFNVHAFSVQSLARVSMFTTYREGTKERAKDKKLKIGLDWFWVSASI